ncbi:hypothetical protein [Gandjariella thermophila]|uniref:PPM-type phosphatase domain-containing protein n=1 Tax=Gandjariella thermophila TaxID=1931992 RepID=A0A4D4J314_9PSEU|nr:hypothetical protein [Gandjariella thermophila]GDY29510.1 hypothetical protein GTS_11430 [Gandjariella thermophila]
MPTVTVAEQPGVDVSGRPRPTEDRVVVLPHAVIVLDGATALRPEARGGGWYAGELGRELADRLTERPGADLTETLAEAIAAVAGAHHLVPGAAPSSTVALLRWDDDVVDGLVLADSPVVVRTASGVDVLTDDRLATLRRRGGGYRGRLARGGGFGADHVAALRASARAVGELRNTDGGFWVAEADPAAAHRGVRRSWPRAEVRAALVASDGVSCGVDDYQLFGWSEVFRLAGEHGPRAVLDAVRDAERADPDGRRWPRPKRHDDQALVLVDLTGPG